MKEKAGSNRVTVAQAAQELGIPAQALRERMKRKIGGIATIGEVLPPLNGKGHLSYLIYRDRLDRYLGKAGKESSDVVGGTDYVFGKETQRHEKGKNWF